MNFAMQGRINLINDIHFRNSTTEFTPIDVIHNSETAEFKCVLITGLNYTFVFVAESDFTNGGNYTLDIRYQLRDSCDRWWNGYRNMVLDFVY